MSCPAQSSCWLLVWGMSSWSSKPVFLCLSTSVPCLSTAPSCLILGLSVSSAVVWPLLSHLGFTHRVQIFPIMSPMTLCCHSPWPANACSSGAMCHHCGTLILSSHKWHPTSAGLCEAFSPTWTSRNPASYFSLSSITSVGFLLSSSPISSLTLICWRQIHSSRLIWSSGITLADPESCLFWISLKWLSQAWCQTLCVGLEQSECVLDDLVVLNLPMIPLCCWKCSSDSCSLVVDLEVQQEHLS